MTLDELGRLENFPDSEPPEELSTARTSLRLVVGRPSSARQIELTPIENTVTGVAGPNPRPAAPEKKVRLVTRIKIRHATWLR